MIQLLALVSNNTHFAEDDFLNLELTSSTFDNIHIGLLACYFPLYSVELSFLHFGHIVIQLDFVVNVPYPNKNKFCPSSISGNQSTYFRWKSFPIVLARHSQDLNLFR